MTVNLLIPVSYVSDEYSGSGQTRRYLIFKDSNPNFALIVFYFGVIYSIRAGLLLSKISRWSFYIVF